MNRSMQAKQWASAHYPILVNLLMIVRVDVPHEPVADHRSEDLRYTRKSVAARYTKDQVVFDAGYLTGP